MAKYLNELEHVEQELAELRNHLQQSFGVLEGLAKVQAQFEDLAQTYQKLKEHLNEVKATRVDTAQVQATFNLAQVQATFNHRFAELEKVIESKSAEVKSELFNVQNERGNADRNLSAELAKQVSDLKGEVEERFTVFLKEWASYKEGMQAPLNEIEARSRNELRAFMNQLSKAGFNDQHFKKQEMLEHQLRLATSLLHGIEQKVQNGEQKLRNMERQMRMMRNWLVVAGLAIVLALALALL